MQINGDILKNLWWTELMLDLGMILCRKNQSWLKFIQKIVILETRN